ncbi:hypothetical protein OBBRIDRAFT_704440, partial [Obba rivulosa]
PPELTDRIVDFLHDDTESLKNCSLTCRSWTPASRYHIFRSVSLIFRSDWTNFERLLRTSPHLGFYVKRL